MGRSKWQRQEHINVLEARALCYGINRVARRSHNLGKRALFLCDSMVVTLASAKGRSSAAALVQVMRRTAALLWAIMFVFDTPPHVWAVVWWDVSPIN